MKTSEEIKHTLRYCWCKDEKHQCIKCPYNKENDSCDKALDADALAYIQQLEDHIRNLTKNGTPLDQCEGTVTRGWTRSVADRTWMERKAFVCWTLATHGSRNIMANRHHKPGKRLVH